MLDIDPAHEARPIDQELPDDHRLLAIGIVLVALRRREPIERLDGLGRMARAGGYADLAREVKRGLLDDVILGTARHSWSAVGVACPTARNLACW